MYAHTCAWLDPALTRSRASAPPPRVQGSYRPHKLGGGEFTSMQPMNPHKVTFFGCQQYEIETTLRRSFARSPDGCATDWGRRRHDC